MIKHRDLLERKVAQIRRDAAKPYPEADRCFIEDDLRLAEAIDALIAAVRVEKLADDRRAGALLREIRGWDMLDGCADGPYWKQKIDAILAVRVDPRPIIREQLVVALQHISRRDTEVVLERLGFSEQEIADAIR